MPHTFCLYIIINIVPWIINLMIRLQNNGNANRWEKRRILTRALLQTCTIPSQPKEKSNLFKSCIPRKKCAMLTKSSSTICKQWGSHLRKAYVKKCRYKRFDVCRCRYPGPIPFDAFFFHIYFEKLYVCVRFRSQVFMPKLSTMRCF